MKSIPAPKVSKIPRPKSDHEKTDHAVFFFTARNADHLSFRSNLEPKRLFESDALRSVRSWTLRDLIARLSEDLRNARDELFGAGIKRKHESFLPDVRD